MIKATFHTDPFYLKNRQFDLNDPVANRDNCLYTSWCLREAFRHNGVDLCTQDIHPPRDAQFVLYNEIPRGFDRPAGKNNYLIILECEAIRPANWDMAKHAFFRKIFTWHDGMVDNKKYFKANFTVPVPSACNWTEDQKSKFCTMIVAQKYVSHPGELYTRRVEAVRWFEKNHPEEFDLYGMGWDHYVFRGPFRKLNRVRPLTRMLKPSFPSYRGTVASKQEVLRQYKFAICYENARGFPGYITEKIFDCFLAGTVPVYWGAPNVTDHIPPAAFVDKRRFKDYESLYAYLAHMPASEYHGYRQAIKDYVESGKSQEYGGEYFAATVVREVMKSEHGME